MAFILRVLLADGTWAEIPALIGPQGSKGNDGVGIVSIRQTTASQEDGGENIFTVELSNGQTATFSVNNGNKGAPGASVVGFTRTSGNGSPGTTDIYTMTFSDGSSFNVPIYNGADGRLTFEDLTEEQKASLKGEPGYTPVKGVDYFDGSPGKDGVSATHSWNGTVLTVTSASGTSSADLKGAKGDTGEVDYSRLNDYAKLASPNNMLHNGNEFTFIPDGYEGQIYINHRTASGQVNGNVSNYYFGNGKGGLATFIAGYFKGKFQGETARPIYNNEEAAMLSDVPTKTETWTFTLEDGSTVTKAVYVG